MLPGDEQRRVTRQYERYAASARKRSSWSAENPGNEAIRVELVAGVVAVAGDELRRARTVLDAGCGTGWWLEALLEWTTADLHGIDALEARVEAAQQRVPSAQVRVGDVRRLPYEDSSFDVVTMFTVLSSLSSNEDIATAVREGVRVLRPGGSLLVWEPRVPNPLNRQTRLVSPALLRSAVAGGAIETRTITLLPALARRLGSRTSRLYPLLARVPPLRTHRLMRLRAGRLMPPQG